MNLIQFVLLILAAISIWRLWQKYLGRDISVVEFIGWLLFWLLTAVVVIFPDLASYVASIFGVGRGSDLVLYIGLVLAFYLIFRIYVRLEKYDRDLTVVVRNLARAKAADKGGETEQKNSSATKS